MSEAGRWSLRCGWVSESVNPPGMPLIQMMLSLNHQTSIPLLSLNRLRFRQSHMTRLTVNESKDDEKREEESTGTEKKIGRITKFNFVNWSIRARKADGKIARHCQSSSFFICLSAFDKRVAPCDRRADLIFPRLNVAQYRFVLKVPRSCGFSPKNVVKTKVVRSRISLAWVNCLLISQWKHRSVLVVHN